MATKANAEVMFDKFCVHELRVLAITVTINSRNTFTAYEHQNTFQSGLKP